MGLNGSVDPRVNRLSSLWPIKSCLGHVVRCWSVDVVRHVGAEISSEFSPCAFERSPPHLFLYLLLFNKTKVETSKTLPVVNTRESKLLLEK